MPWVTVAAAVAPSIIGGILGSGGSSQSQTSQNTIDPRMANYVYGTGKNGDGGILGQAQAIYNKNPSGMNDQMVQGLNQQWQTLTDPSTMGAYKQMSNLGSGLMSTPVMGNPFSDGRASLNAPRPQNLGMGPPNPNNPAMQHSQQAPQQATAPVSYTMPAAPAQAAQPGPFAIPAAPTPATAPPASPMDSPDMQALMAWYQQQLAQQNQNVSGA